MQFFLSPIKLKLRNGLDQIHEKKEVFIDYNFLILFFNI